MPSVVLVKRWIGVVIANTAEVLHCCARRLRFTSFRMGSDAWTSPHFRALFDRGDRKRE